MPFCDANSVPTTVAATDEEAATAVAVSEPCALLAVADTPLLTLKQ